MKVGKTTRVLTVYQWKPDPSKKGNVLVKFAMRYTHPLITKSRYKYLTGGKIKGGILLRQHRQEKIARVKIS